MEYLQSQNTFSKYVNKNFLLAEVIDPQQTISLDTSLNN